MPWVICLSDSAQTKLWPPFSPSFRGSGEGGLGRGNHRQRRTLSESCTRPMTMINYLFGCFARSLARRSLAGCLGCIFVSSSLYLVHISLMHASRFGGQRVLLHTPPSSMLRLLLWLFGGFVVCRWWSCIIYRKSDFSHFPRVFGCLLTSSFLRKGVEKEWKGEYGEKEEMLKI